MNNIDVYICGLSRGASYGCSNVVARNAFMRGTSKYFIFPRSATINDNTIIIQLFDDRFVLSFDLCI